MRPLRAFAARSRAVFRRDGISDEIRDEMRFHLDMRAAQYQRDGLPASVARRAARRRFGNPVLMQDRGYDIRGGGVMETILQDLRYGIRQLRRQPVFSIVAIATLALSIGATSALFSVIDSALIRPLPYPHPEELVDVTIHFASVNQPTQLGPSMSDIRTWLRETSVFTHIGMGRVTGSVPLIVDASEPARLTVGEASDGFLEAYGIVPILGRPFQIDDTRDGAAAVALLGYNYWRTQFNGDPGVLGRTIRVQNAPATIVGVLPEGFYRETAVWQVRQFIQRGSGTPVVGRLRPGLTLEEAQRELDRHTAPSAMFTHKLETATVLLRSLYRLETSGSTPTLKMLAYAVGLILLIACVNVAGLLLARGAVRQTELAVRASIGAGRGRLVRQLLTESLLLAFIAAGLGLALAWLSLDALVTLVPIALPSNAPVAINLRVLGATVAVTVVTAAVFGLVPAFRLSRVARTFGTHLASAGRRVGSPFSRRGGQWLIAIEVALALVLLTSSGLVILSFARLLAVDVGFDPSAVTTMAVDPVDQTPATRNAYYLDLLATIRTLPEIESAGAINALSLHGGGNYGGLIADEGGPIFGPWVAVSSGFFQALGLRATSGHVPVASNGPAQPVAVVDATFAAAHFGGSPIGHTVSEEKPARTFEIVGVVPDVRFGGPQSRHEGHVYLVDDREAAAGPFSAMSVVIRPRAGAALSADRLRHAAQSIGPRVVIGDIQSAADLLGDQIVKPRHRMLLLSLLAGFGLVLALVGIFSVTAYAVARRTQEIGVRMAFGATPRQIVRLVVGAAAWPVVFGLAAGLAGAYYATRVVASFLFHTTPHDPATFAVVSLAIAVSGWLAAWIPARRAARVDPVTALRAD